MPQSATSNSPEVDLSAQVEISLVWVRWSTEPGMGDGESHGPWCGAVLLPAKFLVLMDYNVRCWILDVRWHWSIGPLVHWSIVLISTHTAPVESGSNWPRPWSLWCRSLCRRLGPPLLSVSWVTWHLDSQGPFLVKMDQLHLFLPVSLGKHYASS